MKSKHLGTFNQERAPIFLGGGKARGVGEIGEIENNIILGLVDTQLGQSVIKISLSSSGVVLQKV